MAATPNGSQSTPAFPSHPGNGPTESATLQVRNMRDDIENAEDRVLKALERHHYPEASRFAVRLALEEAISNAFRHGHKGLDPAVPVTLQMAVGPREMVVDIKDRGPGFAPDAVPDPTLDENLERPTGRGLLLMKAYMSSIEYLGNGNHVRMVYKNPGPGGR